MKRMLALLLALLLLPAAALADTFDPNSISTPHVVLMEAEEQRLSVAKVIPANGAHVAQLVAQRNDL